MPEDVEAELASAELDEWLRIFSDATIRPEGPPKPADRPAGSSVPTDFENPFPPGYAEDLLRSDDP
jgi:hypothetical protein